MTEAVGDTAPRTPLERAFHDVAGRLLPIADAVVTRLDYGALEYLWYAPCEELGYLSARIRQSEYSGGDEIVVASKIYHGHFEIDRARWERQYGAAGAKDDWQLIAQMACDEIADVMAGRRVHQIELGPEGRMMSAGSAPRESWRGDPALKEQLGITPGIRRAFDWHGEVD